MQINIAKYHNLLFSKVYPAYIAKAEKKGKTKSQVDQIIFRLTGYDQIGLQNQIATGSTFKTFFDQAPCFNPSSEKITGTICGYRISDITDPIVKKIRYLDKLIDELAKGKEMGKILRG